MESVGSVAGRISGGLQRIGVGRELILWWTSLLLPVLPLAAGALASARPGPWLALMLAVLLPKLAAELRRPAEVATLRCVASTTDFGASLLAVRLCAVPGLMGLAEADLYATLTALLAAAAFLIRAKVADNGIGLAAAALDHELRTPLNAIIGFASLLRDTPAAANDAERCRHYARIIETSGEHMLGVLRAACGQIDRSAAQGPRPRTTDLDASIAECLELLAPLAASRAVSICHRQTARPLQAAGERQPIRQILINLLSNAIKFGPPGGTVNVSTARLGGGTIEIAIADQGEGIDASDLSALGRPFRRGENARCAAIEGSGLGLAISHGLASRQGGRIAIDSKPGRGTTARLRLIEHAPHRPPRPLGPQKRALAASLQSGIGVNGLFSIGGP